jgi:hypothetical protein
MSELNDFDLDDVQRRLRHLLEPGAIADPHSMAYVAHDPFLEQGGVLPNSVIVATHGELHGDPDRLRRTLNARLAPGHIKAVIFCSDGTRVIHLFRIPLAEGGSC